MAFDIIILAVIAGFLGYRLYTVLGQRTPVDRTHYDKQDNVITLPTQKRKSTGQAGKALSPLEKTLSDIQAKDQTFDEATFLAGAKQAFLMISESFEKGDLTEVKQFMGKQIQQSFLKQIGERKKKTEHLSTDLLEVRKATISEATLNRGIATVTVTFVSEQVQLLKNAHGDIIEGDPDQFEDIKDIWTFSRKLGTRDPNWMLVSIAEDVS